MTTVVDLGSEHRPGIRWYIVLELLSLSIRPFLLPFLPFLPVSFRVALRSIGRAGRSKNSRKLTGSSRIIAT